MQPNQETNAPLERVSEAEITPAMKRAGAIAFAESDPRIDDIEDRLAHAFRAMMAARG